jgi:hypothetical protein
MDLSNICKVESFKLYFQLGEQKIVWQRYICATRKKFLLPKSSFGIQRTTVLVMVKDSAMILDVI